MSIDDASFAVRKAYWNAAAVITWISLIPLVFVFQQWQHSESVLRKPFFRPFIFSLLGNAAIILVFLPNHTLNSMYAALDENYTIGNEECNAWAALTVIACTTCITGLPFVWGSTYHNLPLRKGEVKSSVMKHFFSVPVMVVIIFSLSLFWYIGMALEGNVGPSRGLFCLCREFTGFGIGILVVIAIVSMLITLYYVRQVLRTFSSSHSENFDLDLRNTVKHMGTMAVQATIVFFLGWGPASVFCLMSWIGVPVSTSLVLFSGLSIKLQVLPTTVIILRFVRKVNNDKFRLISPFTAAKTDTTEDSDESEAIAPSLPNLFADSTEISFSQGRTKEKFTFVQLTPLEYSAAKRDLKWRVMLFIFEVFDLCLDLLNFIVWIKSDTGRGLFSVLFTISTFMIGGVNLTAMASHVEQTRRILKEMTVGVKVNAKKARYYRNARRETKKGFNPLGSPNSQKANKNDDEGIMEAQLVKAKRDVHYFKFILIGVFVEDIPALLFAVYRMFFMGTIFSKEVDECIDLGFNSSVSNKSASLDILKVSSDVESCMTQTPLTVLSHVFIMNFLQILGCTASGAVKLGFLRDYFRLKKTINVMEANFKNDTSKKTSLLDFYLQGQVDEEEINNVTKLRQTVESFKFRSRKFTDLQTLIFLRRGKGDIFFAARELINWLRWKSDYKSHQTRYKVLMDNSSMDDLAEKEVKYLRRIEPINSSIKLFFGHSVAKIPELAFFVDIDWADLEYQLEHSDAFRNDFQMSIACILERISVQVECLAQFSRRVPTVKLICNMKELRKEFVDRFLSDLTWMVGVVEMYPINFDIILVSAGEWLYEYTFNHQIEYANTIDDIVHFLPRQLLPEKFSDFLSQNPTALQQSPEEYLHLLKPTVSERSLKLSTQVPGFPCHELLGETSSQEQFDLVDIKVSLFSLYAKAYEDKKEYGEQCLHERIAILEEQIAFWYSSPSQNSIGIMEAELAMIKYVLIGGTVIDHLPRYVLGAAGCLRLLRSGVSIKDTTAAMAKMILYRLENQINDVRVSEIPDEIASLESFQMKELVFPFFHFDQDGSRVICFFNYQSKQSLRDKSPKELKEIADFVHEYLLSLSFKLSLTYSELVTVLVVSRSWNPFDFFFRDHALRSVSQHLVRDSTHLFYEKELIVTKMPLFIASTFAFFANLSNAVPVSKSSLDLRNRLGLSTDLLKVIYSGKPSELRIETRLGSTKIK